MINNTKDFLKSEDGKKLSYFMIILFIFTFVFRSKSLYIKNIIIQNIHVLFPSLQDVEFTIIQTFDLWVYTTSFLMFMFVGCLILAKIKKKTIVSIKAGMIIFRLNSILFVALLIYANLTSWTIFAYITETQSFSSFNCFSVFAGASVILFIFLFGISVYNEILLLFKRQEEQTES